MCHKVHDIGLKNPRYCFQLHQYYASALKYGNRLYKNKSHAYKNNSRLDFAQALLRSPLQEFVRWVGCKEWHKINKFGCWGLVFATLSHWVCPRSLFEWLCRVCPFQRYHLQQPCRKVHLSGVKSSFYFGFQGRSVSIADDESTRISSVICSWVLTVPLKHRCSPKCTPFGSFSVANKLFFVDVRCWFSSIIDWLCRGEIVGQYIFDEKVAAWLLSCS